MISAVIHDPGGRKWSRRWPLVVALLSFGACLWLKSELLFHFGLPLLALGCLWPRWRSGRGTVTVGPGKIRIAKAGLGALFGRRIRTKDIVGGSTARLGEGVVLTLAVGKQPAPPVTLELESESDAQRIREALAIGHNGFGSVLWPVAPTGPARGRSALAAVVFLSSLVLLALCLGGVTLADSDVSLPFWIAVWVGFPLLGLFALDARVRTAPYVALRGDGVHCYEQGRWQSIPYANVLGIERRGNRLFVWKHDDPIPAAMTIARSLAPESLSNEGCRHLSAQVGAALARSRGEGAKRAEIETRVDALRRVEGEQVRAWLSRLEVAARSVDAGGYRGGVLAERDLWTLYEDPDADPAMRVAAARVLGRVVKDEQQRNRLAVIAGAERDVSQANRLRIAIDEDLEVAVENLGQMEEELVAPSARA